MKADKDAGYRKLLGARVLSEANDLKRTRQALASELGKPQAFVDAVIDGTASVADAQDLMRSMAEVYPISLSDLWLERDDSDDGVIIMTGDASERTARVFDRQDRDGNLTPYYEYRDTAMSRLGPFKPEWIRELRMVDDANPDNPDVAYNNGHLMHQQTFFIGEVNFYWALGGRNHCAEMNTGDSNYITPFVPHSFTSRNPDAPGLIVAVTFGGEIRRALDDFARLDAETAAELASDLRDPNAAYRARLSRYLAMDSMTGEGFAQRLESSGVTHERAAALASGTQPSSSEEGRTVAEALGVRPEDLMLSGLEIDGEVVVRRADASTVRHWPNNNDFDCRLTELARTKHLPALKGFAAEVVGNSPNAPGFRHHLFEYGYNYGDEPVALLWGEGREALIHPGDSACVHPMVAHRFARPSGAGEGRLCIVRVPGALNDLSMDEYARFDTAGRRRVNNETKQWF